jgi:hypothetical protein
MPDGFSLLVDIIFLHVGMGTNTFYAETRCNNTVIAII